VVELAGVSVMPVRFATRLTLYAYCNPPRAHRRSPRSARRARLAVEGGGGGSGDDGGSSDPAPKLTFHSFTATCCTPWRRAA
jgi:hypothetical protein